MPVPGSLTGSLLGFAQQVFELREDLLDRIEIGAVGRQEPDSGPGPADHRADGFAFMAAKIVHHDDVAGLQGWDQHLRNMKAGDLAIDRPVEHEGSGDGVLSQGSQEG